MSDALKVALLGCGVVGSQVVRLLHEQADDLAARIGAPLELAGVAVRRPGRHTDLPADLVTTDAAELVSRDDIDVVVEVIGGIEPVRTLLLDALARGKSVVSANKALLAEDGATWVDGRTGVEAAHVAAGSQAAKAGVRPGDVLLRINGYPVSNALKVTQLLVGVGSWNKADYQVRRHGVEFKTTLIVGEVPADPVISYQYVVGLAYLVIGLFVGVAADVADRDARFFRQILDAPDQLLALFDR